MLACLDEVYHGILEEHQIHVCTSHGVIVALHEHLETVVQELIAGNLGNIHIIKIYVEGSVFRLVAGTACIWILSIEHFNRNSQACK